MMDDLISRQAAIDAIEHITSSMSVCINTDECHGMKRMQRQAVIELANLPSEQRWIPCSERLPDVGKEVLVCYDFKGYRSVLAGTLYGDEKFHGYEDEYLTPEGRLRRKAVAWMPLPEPYAERREE